jgi:hypothetical protein
MMMKYCDVRSGRTASKLRHCEHGIKKGRLTRCSLPCSNILAYDHCQAAVERGSGACFEFHAGDGPSNVVSPSIDREVQRCVKFKSERARSSVGRAMPF